MGSNLTKVTGDRKATKVTERASRHNWSNTIKQKPWCSASITEKPVEVPHLLLMARKVKSVKLNTKTFVFKSNILCDNALLIQEYMFRAISNKIDIRQ